MSTPTPTSSHLLVEWLASLVRNNDRGMMAALRRRPDPDTPAYSYAGGFSEEHPGAYHLTAHLFAVYHGRIRGLDLGDGSLGAAARRIRRGPDDPGVSRAMGRIVQARRGPKLRDLEWIMNGLTQGRHRPPEWERLADDLSAWTDRRRDPRIAMTWIEDFARPAWATDSAE